MTVPKEIEVLVEHFSRSREAYQSGKYNETQLRREFIDPLFKALGWDMDNTAGHAEAYKDVIHEDAIKVGSATKAPDYCFRIGGTRKFFVEGKKPSVNIAEDVGPAYQLRRYAWSAKLPLSILTDFEEFVVYDCRIKPDKSDKASTARIIHLNDRDYLSRWEEIASVFSKEAVLKGSFDRYADTAKLKKGTAGVDDAFLGEIETWRKMLAGNIALRNPCLTQREINTAVTATINRIIFLRICEDRGIETYGQLMALQNGADTYDRLIELYYAADDKYNSGLFHFRRERDRLASPDTLTLNLAIDDKTLKDIFRSLYYPDSPYEFSVLPADILGQVYEQFLGKVIHLTAGHRATVQDKPEVKKAGGIYYTPTYIVDYIVRNSVGRLLPPLNAVDDASPVKKRGTTSPKQAAGIRILDPACGSGSFLLGAYQYLLDWHLGRYLDNEPEKRLRGKSPVLCQGPGGDWRLTTSERKRVLLNNIYGVDIDSQAVEVTKLSLLLKVLEGENEQTLSNQLKLFHERALPDLGNNIKCGNSLIGPDFYDNQQLGFFEDEERYRINVFDWEKEFPEIMKAGGFEVVIGNPPWGALFEERELDYLRQRNREIIVRMIDSFMYFVYQSNKILKTDGFFGMILPDVVLYQIDNRKLREFILNCYKIDSILNMGDVFDKVTRPACILVLEQGQSAKHVVTVVDLSGMNKNDKPAEIWNKKHYLNLYQANIRDVPGSLFVTSITEYIIWTKVNKVPHLQLQELVDGDGIQRGVSPDLKEAFLVDSETARKSHLETQKLRAVLTGGRQVKRYFIEHPDLLLIYTRRDDNFRELPNICEYIYKFRNKITCKEVKLSKHPLYALHRAREEKIFLKKEKLIGVITGDEIVVALDKDQTFATDGLYLFGIRNSANIKYLMGILNSKLFVFIYHLLTLEKGRVLAQVKPTILEQLPIRTINFSDPADGSRHDRMVVLVEQMLSLQKKLAATKTDHEKTNLQRQIDATDSQIDRLVYDLYELTEKEIGIVENGG